MARFYRSIMDVCWALGMLTLIAAVVLHFSPVLSNRFSTDARAALIFSGVIFLGAIATRAVGRTGIEPGK
jgi:hypothetical protein